LPNDRKRPAVDALRQRGINPDTILRFAVHCLPAWYPARLVHLGRRIETGMSHRDQASPFDDSTDDWKR
jgi:hypothetical protein